MRFRLYREYGALNSKPIFDAFEQGLKVLGHESVTSDDAIPVIWSVLWSGRMAQNYHIYNSKKPVVIIEVGNLKRNTTWRVSLNHVNRLGEFANISDLDLTRSEKIGINLHPIHQTRRPEILITTQHAKSLQWQGQGNIEDWLKNTVDEIRRYSSRPIVVRPHPRCPISPKISGISIEHPKKLQGTYDDFDIDYNYHCVVNHNSGPTVQAAIHGTPIICDSSSLAYEMSGNFENIENISLPPREDWFLRLCHTEWTVEEIAKGIPLSRIFSKIS